MREKLIELLDDIQQCGEDFTEYEIYGMRLPNTVSNETIADHLIANGVTFAKDTNVHTNGDRIRAMTDEELAVVVMCPKEIGHDVLDCCLFPTCTECALAWLKQPVEVE